jgi:hypothetical protein
MLKNGYNEEPQLLGAKTDLEEIQSALREFYEALSEHDPKGFESITAPGFCLLEHGEYWDLGFLQHKIGDIKPPNFSRKNHFDFKRIEVFGEDAFAVWDLHAEIIRDARKTDRYWLESGSFKKIDGQWKVHFLHSTRVPSA